MKLLSGNSNLPLVQAISRYLEIPITEALVRRFADEEIFVEILDNVRGEDVFVVQSTSYPANDNLMELLICIDALRRASAKRITAVLPYFGYARQDRKPGPRTPISAKLVANLITVAGANRVLSVDLHAGQIQGFFDIPPTTFTARRSCRPTFRRVMPGATSRWSRLTSAAWSAPALSQSGSTTPRSPSSTSAASGPASRRS
jgi:ribose-phosphate pyrophosphokinase